MNGARYPQWAYAAALASLPLLTHARLRRLIAHDKPSVVWNMLQEKDRPLPGFKEDTWRVWCNVPQSMLIETAELCIDSNIIVTTNRDRLYPVVLHADPQAPAVIFSQGNLEVLHQRRVGVVGTRTATQAGRHFARTLGESLANAEVCVVSGLARGIDFESHVGVFRATAEQAAPPAAVVASGLNKVYPPEHHELWRRIASEGVLISEAPPNAPAETHRFPLRNRILASLSEVLVVVESRARGGSMITVREAMKRDITVMAVPGAPNVSSCEGTNLLLRDGCAPVLDVDDVFVALGLDTRRENRAIETRQMPTADERAVLEVLAGVPRSIDEVALLAGCSVVNMAVLLGRLEAKEWVSHVDGWWEALLH
jgi:DNA processing protein